jgi:DNA-binding MarR family transcriptional regulator
MSKGRSTAGRPAHPVEQDAYIELQRTADALARVLADVLKPAGLTAAQFNVLRILRGVGVAGATCCEVGTRMITRDPDVTRLVDRLEKRGLVARARDARDRRVVLLRITSEGLRLLAGLDDRIIDIHRAQLGHVGHARLQELIELLKCARTPP